LQHSTASFHKQQISVFHFQNTEKGLHLDGRMPEIL
jgi:hypothetical protein